MIQTRYKEHHIPYSNLDEVFLIPDDPEAAALDEQLFRDIESLPQPETEIIEGAAIRNRVIADFVERDPFFKDEQNFRALEKTISEEGGFDIPFGRKKIRVGDEKHDLVIVGATDPATGHIMGSMFWIRDQVRICAAAMQIQDAYAETYHGMKDKARVILPSLLTMMSTPKQLSRLNGLIKNGQNEHYVMISKNWPHVFFRGVNLSGRWNEDWAHKQDAHQMLAITALDAIESGFLTDEQIRPGHKEFLGKLVPLLAAIDFTSVATSGSWEEFDTPRTTVLTWDVALLAKIRSLRDNPQFNFLRESAEPLLEHLPPAYAGMSFDAIVDTMLDVGKTELKRRIPEGEAASYPQDPLSYRKEDAAYSYMLELGIPALLADSEIEEHALEVQILEHIMPLMDRKVGGIRRYFDDRYLNSSFHTNTVQRKLTELYANKHGQNDLLRRFYFAMRKKNCPPGAEALWTHFVFDLSTWAGQRFQETGEERYKTLQEDFFRRGLGLYTGFGEHTVNPWGNPVSIRAVDPFRLPEAYVRLPQGNQLGTFPDTNIPLYWSVSTGIRAFNQMAATRGWK